MHKSKKFKEIKDESKISSRGAGTREILSNHKRESKREMAVGTRAISAVEISRKHGDRAVFGSRLIFFKSVPFRIQRNGTAWPFRFDFRGAFTVPLFPEFHSRTGGGGATMV